VSSADSIRGGAAERRFQAPRRSARLRRPIAAVVAVALTVAVSGCVSTQQKAAWLHVTDARVIASQGPTIVRHPGVDVKVAGVTVLRSGKQLAFVVRLRNTTTYPVNDIPVSVGLVGHEGARVYLNRAAGLNYYKTHVVEIPASATETWVVTTGSRVRVKVKGSHRTIDATGRPFAVAGDEAVHPFTVVHSIPRVRAVASPSASTAGPLRVVVTNLSQIPQVGLQVYAVALHGRRVTAAGSATIGTLGTGNSVTTSLGLIGHQAGTQVELEALPTLF
jgi:adenosine/AMP kinase